MKSALCILIFFSAAIGLAQQQEDSPMVKAAKASGGPKKKSTTKVITNADVKKTKGKLVVLPQKKSDAAEASPKPVDNRGPLQKQDDDRRAMDAATVQVTTAQKKVDDLTKELRRIEETYYAENDPNYRDSTIAGQFKQAKQQLDDARKELADARDAQQKLKP